jgi:hypothetical protein
VDPGLRRDYPNCLVNLEHHFGSVGHPTVNAEPFPVHALSLVQEQQRERHPLLLFTHLLGHPLRQMPSSAPACAHCEETAGTNRGRE